MMTVLHSRLERYPLASFYLLAFLFTWTAWFPQAAHSHGLFPFDHFLFYFIGGVSPLLAAYVVLRSRYDSDEANRQLFQPLFKWRLPLRWYATILLLVIWMESPSFLQGGESLFLAPSLADAGNWAFSFFRYGIAAIPEELAWRGFALPRFQKKYSAFASSMVVGVLWAFWHAPLLFNADNVMSTYPLLPWFIDVMMDSIIYVWLYNSTKGSVFLLVLYHALSNATGSFQGWPSALMSTVAALFLLARYTPATLSTTGQKYRF